MNLRGTESEINKRESGGEPPAKKQKQVERSNEVLGQSMSRSNSFVLKNMSDSLPIKSSDKIINLIDNNSNVILFDDALSRIDKLPVNSKSTNHPGSSIQTLSVVTKLEEVLWSCAEGKGIVRYFNQHKSFDEFHRKKLSKLIVQFEINKSCASLSLKGEDKLKEFVLTTNELKEYADLIVHHFPTEVIETYFIPSQNTKKKRMLASGRLWDSYNNAKKTLREDYLLERKINK